MCTEDLQIPSLFSEIKSVCLFFVFPHCLCFQVGAVDSGKAVGTAAGVGVLRLFLRFGGYW